MEIRKAKIGELEAIMLIIKEVVIDMQASGIDQWDTLYPNKEVIGEDIMQGNLYVSTEDDIIKGIVALNEAQAEEYGALDWKYSSGKQMIIHRLCVKPTCQRNGIAQSLIKFSEDFARSYVYNAIRLDTFIHNKRACKFYEQLQYEKVGIVNYRKGEFQCYEKVI